MFRQLSIFSKIMFGTVAALLIATIALGVTTAVKAGKGEIGAGNTPTPSEVAEATSTPKPSTDLAHGGATPTPTDEAKKYIVALDPGQQKNQDTDTEPEGPGSSITVTKMSYGATSVTTKEREYIWTLRMAELVKTELETRNYEVVLCRDTNDENFNLSNSERAQKANDANADILISLQLDAASSESAKGMYVVVPADDNVYLTPTVLEKGQNLGKVLLETLLEKTGANDRGTNKKNDQAEINWAKMPTAIINLGFASNKEEDTLLQSAEYMQKLTGAICDAIDKYFESQKEFQQ